MKYLLTALLITNTLTLFAQQQKDANTPKSEKKLLTTPSKTEAGFDAGYCPIEYGGGPTGRVVISSRAKKHVQLFCNLDVVLSGLRTDIGLGAGANFPVGSQRSYFYPGIYVGYYMGTSAVVGGQLGYTGYVNNSIALHIEGGYRWGSSGGTLSRNVTYVPVVVGMRFSLD